MSIPTQFTKLAGKNSSNRYTTNGHIIREDIARYDQNCAGQVPIARYDQNCAGQVYTIHLLITQY